MVYYSCHIEHDENEISGLTVEYLEGTVGPGEKSERVGQGLEVLGESLSMTCVMQKSKSSECCLKGIPVLVFFGLGAATIEG